MKKLLLILKYLAVYFVSLVLILFSVSKFLDAQFRIWNITEYTPLREVGNMAVAWSFLGHSYYYNLFLGIAEFAAGIFILFQRTRLVGLLMALGLYMNIVMVDIVFDVDDALGHAVFELALIIALLIPYAGDLKKFFWDMGGRIQNQPSPPGKIMGLYLPSVFILACTIGSAVLINNLLSAQSKLIGAYEISMFSINQDTIQMGQGQYTKKPMLFLEFGNACALSLQDKSYWGRFSQKNDSITLTIDEKFNDVKVFNAAINKDINSITGTTDKSEPFEMKINRVE
jgi:hypothetical protein